MGKDATGDAGETRPEPQPNQPEESAPEWPLTRESRSVERDRAEDGDAETTPAEPTAEDAVETDRTEVEPSPDEEPRAAAAGVDDAGRTDADADRDESASTGRHAAEAERAEETDETATTLLPAATEPPAESDATTVLPAADRGQTDATAIVPGMAAGHATIPDAADPGSAFLVAQELSATGSEGAVFTSVSVTADRGEVVALVGDSGTGRTALLLALAGRFVFQSGSLSVAGQSRPARIRDAVAVAVAAPAVTFDDNHTVAAVLWESATVGGVAEAEVRRRCTELGLNLDTGAPFGTLSRVERTLLALASAWAVDAPAIAVDDLDSGVNDEGRAALWEAVRRIADDNRLVLAAAVRAGGAVDRVVHPRPLALHRHPH